MVTQKYNQENTSAMHKVIERIKSGVNDNQLQFLTMSYLPELYRQLCEKEAWLSGFTHMLVLGIGGSALGSRFLQKAFYPEQDEPGHVGKSLWILDNLDSAKLARIKQNLLPDKTLIVVVSKSGNTIETVSQYLIFKTWLKEHLNDAWLDHILYITDAEKGFLRKEVERYSARDFEVPKNVGGRYSILTAVGLVPAVFLGIDWRSLVAGAQSVSSKLLTGDIEKTLLLSSAWNLALWGYEAMNNGHSVLVWFCYVPQLASFGDWFSQLWSESLGKNGCGSTPLSAVGVTDQHSLQQLFLGGPKDKIGIFLKSSSVPEDQYFPSEVPTAFNFLKNKSVNALSNAEYEGSKAAWAKAGVDFWELDVKKADEYEVGKLILTMELVTVFTGWMLGINPFDQPHVEYGKNYALEVLTNASS